MLENHITELLIENLDYKPTGSQQNLIHMLASFLTGSDQKEVLLVKGYAGTGKTTIVSSLVKTLDRFGVKYVLLAPTGRAAKVLSSYSTRQAFTIHKKIYRQKSLKEGIGEFILDRNLHTNTFFVVDEASMIANQMQEMNIFGSGRLLDDLIAYVYNNKRCKLILIGDTAQLPPVGLELSPALDQEILEKYQLNVKSVFLEDVIRHTFTSGILANATQLRKKISGNRISLPKFSLSGHSDMNYLSGENLLEEISHSYDKYGIDNTIVITRSNKRANEYNNGIRSRILLREQEIIEGDFLMVVRNNYFWLDENHQLDFIANGDITEILKIFQYQERYGYRFADVLLRFPDYQNLEVRTKIMLDILHINVASLGSEESRIFYNNILEDYPDIKSKRKKYEMIREHPFYNALQVKFAYAVTCHKAQGGQWNVVFIDQGYISDEMINKEYLRWLYTAVTRATDKLYLVNFGSEYFEDEI